MPKMQILVKVLKFTSPAGSDLGPKGPMGQAPNSCFGLAGLPVVPCLSLVWPWPVLTAMPHQRRALEAIPPSNNNMRAQGPMGV